MYGGINPNTGLPMGFAEGPMMLIHSKTAYTEHELQFTGFTMKEIKEFSNQMTVQGEPYRTVMIYTRSIGPRVVQMTETRSGGQIVSSAVNTTMSEGELPAFEAEWSRMWTPNIRDPSSLQAFDPVSRL